MNYYFFPDIDHLETAVTLANFAPNGSYQETQEYLFVHVAWADGEKWCVEIVDTVAAGQSLQIKKAQLPQGCMIPGAALLFFSGDDLTGTHETLPDAHIMQTVPAWRSNIKLNGQKTSVSYQGEYPAGMVNIPQGTFLSISPMLQRQDGIGTQFLFPTFKRVPSINTHRILFYNWSENKICKEATIRANACTAIDMTDLEADPDDIIVTYSLETTGIPLYLSHNDEFSQMSLEHTHPPVEYALFGDRAAVQKNMKHKWFETLPW
jgi:hypothetical protein